MAKQLTTSSIAEGLVIEAGHVTQSAVAFTGGEAYDITISGSLAVTGSTSLNGNLTASGVISASGEIEANKFVSNGVDVAQFAAGAVQLGGGILQPTTLSGTNITLGITGQNQPVTIISALTASGDISASSDLIGNGLTIGGSTGPIEVFNDPFILKLASGSAGGNNDTLRSSDKNLFVNSGGGFDTVQIQNAGLVVTSITASGNVSASGNGIFKAGKPITTHTSSPISSSYINAGGYHVVGGNLTASIVLDSTAPVGAEYEFFQSSSTGQFLFESASGTTVISKNGSMRLAQQGSSAVLKKVSTTTFHLMGDLT